VNVFSFLLQLNDIDL